MPNIAGPREAKRRLVASVVHSKLLYVAPVWANRFIGGGKTGDLSAPQGAYLYRPAGNRSREGGHPQGWKAQTSREMAERIAW